MAKGDLVSCGRGHAGLTQCPNCGGTGHVKSDEKDSKGASQHCESCQGSGLLQAHPLSCTG